MNELTEGFDVNEVHLRGRLAQGASIRELPSGDVLAIFRVTVRRPPDERGTVDAIDCVTTRSRVRRTIEAAAPGEEVELAGSLRRRFWRGPTGAQSRYAVDVVSARRTRPARTTAPDTSRPRSSGSPVSVPDRRGGASRARKPASE